MPTDFRDGKTFPRRGRDKSGDAMWLKRVSDKGRASLAGTIHDYIYPCPIDKAVLERWGVTVAAFEDALRANPDDAGMLAWLTSTVSAERIEATNTYLLTERVANMDKQDAEEGVLV